MSDPTMQALAEVQALVAESDAAPVVKPPSIHVLIARVIRELPAIGKDQRNAQQGFNFRGVDDVLDALKPLLGRHGVFAVPTVLDRIAEARTTKSNSVLWTIHLHVRFRLYGPAGDFVEGDAWGEGTDSGDKATSKAHTMAFKYFLFETFAVANSEHQAADNDGHTAPETQQYPTLTAQTIFAFTVAAHDRGIGPRELGDLVMQVTDGRTHLIAEVRRGDEQAELKALIARHDKPTETVQQDDRPFDEPAHLELGAS